VFFARNVDISNALPSNIRDEESRDAKMIHVLKKVALNRDHLSIPETWRSLALSTLGKRNNETPMAEPFLKPSKTPRRWQNS
jgi:hypothetical protein